MAGIRLFVFALTPRAGARHQVYLVSRDDPRLKRRIEQLVPEINKTVASAQEHVVTGPGFVVAWHMVRQPTTGRMAPEWICLASDPAASLKPQEKAKATDWLTAKLHELAQIVTRHSWNDEGPLFEKLPQLQSWEKIAQDMFEICPLDSGSAPGTEPSQPRKRRWRCPVGTLLVGCLPKPKKDKYPGPIRCGTLLVGCLLLIVVGRLLLIGVLGFLESSSIRKKVGEWCWKGTTRPVGGSWAKLAEAVGVPNQEPQKILKKLKCLFEPDSNPEQEIEKEIEKLLQAFEKAMGRSGKENLQTLSQSPKLLEELQKLFPQGKFDPMGLVLVPPKTAQFWRSLLPPVFDKLQNSLAQAAKSPDLWQLPKISNELLDAVGLKEQMPCYVKIFKVLADYTPSQGPNHPEQMGPQRRFYVPSQQDSLEKVHRVLTSICQACRELKKQELKTSSASSGTSQEEAPCEDNVKDCLKTIVATLQERLPGAIENTNKVPDPDEENLVKLRQALETLQKLVNEWKEVDKCR
jgi:hypothetical protein